MEPTFDGKKPGKAKTIWLVIVIFLFGLSNTAWGLFYFKQYQEHDSLSSKVSNLTNSNDQLSTQVKKLNTEANSLREEIKDTKEESQGSTWRVVPEMGIKYKLDTDTADLTYTYLGGATQTPYITWSSKSITNKSTPTDSCNSYNTPMARWGTAKSTAATGISEKKVGEKTIYATSEEANSEKPAICKDPALTAKFQTAIKKAFDSLQPIDS